MAVPKVLALIAIVFLACLPVESFAHEIKAGELVIVHPWMPEPLQGAKAGVVYLKIQNTGQKPDELLGAESVVAESVTVHELKDVGGVVKMQKRDSVEIPPKGEIELKPMAIHLMLSGTQENPQRTRHVFHHFEVQACGQCRGRRRGYGSENSARAAFLAPGRLIRDELLHGRVPKGALSPQVPDPYRQLASPRVMLSLRLLAWIVLRVDVSRMNSLSTIFLVLSHERDRPLRYRLAARLDTMPSSPSSAAALKNLAPSPSRWSLNWIGSRDPAWIK